MLHDTDVTLQAMKVFADARKQLGSIRPRGELAACVEHQVAFLIFAKLKLHVVEGGIRIFDHERFTGPHDEHFWHESSPAHSKLGGRAVGWFRARPDTGHHIHHGTSQPLAILRRGYFPSYF